MLKLKGYIAATLALSCVAVAVACSTTASNDGNQGGSSGEAGSSGSGASAGSSGAGGSAEGGTSGVGASGGSAGEDAGGTAGSGAVSGSSGSGGSGGDSGSGGSGASAGSGGFGGSAGAGASSGAGADGGSGGSSAGSGGSGAEGGSGGDVICESNTECAGSEFCDFQDTSCGAGLVGVCRPRPSDCPDSIPICGCDGQRYMSACAAQAAGTDISDSDSCPCLDTSECRDSQYCEKASCSGGVAGQCSDRPTECPPGINWHCGCDGVNYWSECAAAQVGINAPASGKCPCSENDDCGTSIEYCKKVSNVCSSNSKGTCTSVPDSCDLTLAPVCGCDGQTYDNACFAEKAGANVASAGECPCFANSECDAAEYCKKPDDACSSSSPGSCTLKPVGACTAISNPQCGCDGVTYANPCFAEKAGANIEKAGAC